MNVMIDVEEMEVDVEAKDESESELGRNKIRVVPHHCLSFFMHLCCSILQKS
jgi:hypothetical protein